MSVEIGVGYRLTADDGTSAVFNDSTDADFVGFLTDIAGLDSPEVRTSGQDFVEADGGVNGNAYFGRRPVSLEGILPQSSLVVRGDRIQRLQRIGRRCMRADATLTWTENDGIVRRLLLRRAGRWPITGLVDKRFILPLISASHLIESNAEVTLTDNASPLSVSATNSGNAEALPTITIANSGGSATTNPLTVTIGGVVVFVANYAIPAGQSVRINFKDRTFTNVSSGANLYSTITFASTTWAGIGPGTHTVASDRGTSLTVVFRHSWA